MDDELKVRKITTLEINAHIDGLRNNKDFRGIKDIRDYTTRVLNIKNVDWFDNDPPGPKAR